eukprot:Em0003g312a
MQSSDPQQGPAVVDIPTAPSIKEGLQRFANDGIPFVVRSLAALDMSYDEFKERAKMQRWTICGWDRKQDMVSDVLVAGALEDWEKDELQLNFFGDNTIPKFASNEAIHQDLLDVGLNENRFMLVLSNKGAYTPFHQDPIGDTNGAGFMWLLRGVKRWNFLSWERSISIFNHETKSLDDVPTENLVRLDNNKLWGKLMKVTIRAGDFLFVPPACSHRVWTDEPSIGVTGYIRRPEDEERRCKAVGWYKTVGLDPELGVWFPGAIRKQLKVTVP